MNGLGGLNKSPEGVVIGLVQRQLPVVVTKADLLRCPDPHIRCQGGEGRGVAADDHIDRHCECTQADTHRMAPWFETALRASSP
jgi:hypothetical protein